jgi:predicted Zn finger-like uncharacterized protein
MRLICPNCDAEYLVDDAAIPDTGRDVQCSNCGHAWFQLRPEVEAMLAQEEALFGAVEDTTSPASAVPQPTPPVADMPAPVPTVGTVSEPVRRNLDESILSVLREEAEREAAARRAEAPPMEAQVEMGLPEPAAPPAPSAGVLDATARRLARLKGLDPDARPVPPAKPGSRRELLPDIEEINSSLKPTQRPTLDEDGEEILPATPSSGFRSGFLLMLILAAALVAAYVMAPKIAQQFPGAEGAMTAYVAQVDAARLWLDGVLRGLTEQLQSVSGQAPGP